MGQFVQFKYVHFQYNTNSSLRNVTYIIALDQGTTSSRAVLFDLDGNIQGIEQQEFLQIFPNPGWVEHDPIEIWTSQYAVLKELIEKNNVDLEQVRAIGITNQRETTVCWDAETGKPLGNAIVWQDKRTAGRCEELKEKGLASKVRQQTGLVLDAYFSATKMEWMLKEVPGAREKAEEGTLRFGTVDTWLIWQLTKGESFVTDQTNASRTLLYNIRKQQWDNELLELFGIPRDALPEVLPSASNFGIARIDDVEIPILGVAGDQQAALFGQACLNPGEVKNTYGTGCFMLMNMGEEFMESKHGLLTTMTCSTDGKPKYAFEGSIFIAGAVVQWLRDGLKIIEHAAESEDLAKKADEHEVVLVPAFTGLGAPYWDQHARGAIFGLTRATGKDHLARAALESIAYQTVDILKAMELDSGISITELRVDGGAAANDYLMQFQADMLGVAVVRPHIMESTALGAAYLAGIQAGVWSEEDLTELRKTKRKHTSTMTKEERERRYASWKRAVARTLNWTQ